MKVSSVVCGVLGAVFALAISPAHADQMNDLCIILNTTRNNQAALKRQIENERNPLKQDSLKGQLDKSIEQGDAFVRNFLEVNNRQFTNFTGVISSFETTWYNSGPGVLLKITLPCQLTIFFRFLETTHPEWGKDNPEEEGPLSKWRSALENFVKGDSVTFSGRFTRNSGLARAVMTELRKKGGIAYKVPDEYILRENARREDELRQEKIIQDIASQLSGKWEGEWKLGGIVNPLATNEGAFSLDLIRDGSVLTGTYHEKGGSSAISGNIDGKQISFGYQYTDGTNRTFTGIINATGEISGQWRQTRGSGTWRMVKISSTTPTPQGAEPLACVPARNGDPEPWRWNSRVLDSFRPDTPKPEFVGTFRDDRSQYELSLWSDSKGVFGELRSPVLEADSPTSRLYDPHFDLKTGTMDFTVRFGDGERRFAGTLRSDLVTGTVQHAGRSEPVAWQRQRADPADEDALNFPRSRAEFECAMILFRRY